MEVLALITARAGSKGLPGKNILPFLGKPLIAWTCEAAARSKKISRSILSTDGQDIINVARACGMEVPFIRPVELASDTATHAEVVTHALDFLKDKENYVPDWVVVLQPTSPLRTAADIDAAIELAVEKNADSVVSVTEVMHAHPYIAQKILSDGRMQPFMENIPSNLRRQDMPPAYVPNGALYVLKTAGYRAQKTLYMRENYAYVMPFARSVDIDTRTDFQLAEFVKDLHE